MNFAKLFQVEDNTQVLFTCEYDIKTENHQVVIRTDFGDDASIMKVAVQDETAALGFIEKVELKHASEFRDILYKLLIQEKAKLN